MTKNISQIQLDILTEVIRFSITVEEFQREFSRIYTLEEVAIEFFEMFRDGLIIGSKWLGEGDSAECVDFIPKLEEIYGNIDRNFHFFYYLSPIGIELWQEVAQPKWEQFARGGYRRNETYDDIVPNYKTEPPPPPIEKYEGLRSYGDMCCMDKGILEKFVKVSHLLGESIYIIPDTEVWDTFEPWYINYWKTLPMAHRVTYQIIERGCNQKTDDELTEEEREARAWYKNIRKWHLNVYQG